MSDPSTNPTALTGPDFGVDEDTLVMSRPDPDEVDISTDELPAPPKMTGRFDKRGFASIDELIGHPRADGYPTGNFTLVPANMADKAYEPGVHRWWVELWSDDIGSEPVRLEIVGDVVLGRSNLADVDLHEYGAIDRGVSRKHALLRPSKKALYLLDLGSTNGTHFNGIPMGQGIAMSLSENAVIRLGRLNLTVRFLAVTD